MLINHFLTTIISVIIISIIHIRYGKTEASLEEIVKAAKAAYADEFIL